MDLIMDLFARIGEWLKNPSTRASSVRDFAFRGVGKNNSSPKTKTQRVFDSVIIFIF